MKKPESLVAVYIYTHTHTGIFSEIKKYKYMNIDYKILCVFLYA